MAARDEEALRLLAELGVKVTLLEISLALLIACAQEDVCSLDDQPFGPGDRCPFGRSREESDAYEAHCARFAHDCPRERFLDDPITRAYGVGSEMVGRSVCPVCDRLEAGGV